MMCDHTSLGAAIQFVIVKLLFVLSYVITSRPIVQPKDAMQTNYMGVTMFTVEG